MASPQALRISADSIAHLVHLSSISSTDIRKSCFERAVELEKKMPLSVGRFFCSATSFYSVAKRRKIRSQVLCDGWMGTSFLQSAGCFRHLFCMQAWGAWGGSFYREGALMDAKDERRSCCIFPHLPWNNKHRRGDQYQFLLKW